MRIGMIGFTLVNENKGCEALTYSMLQIFRTLYPNRHIEVVFFTSEKLLGDAPKLFPEFVFITKKLSLRYLRTTILNEFNQCDVIYDVTFGDGFSDIYFLKPMFRNVLIKYIAGKSKSIFILAPQTYGPFTNKGLRFCAGKAIKAADYVYARDEMSSELARKLSRRDVKTVTDLAFLLPYERPGRVEKLQTAYGINISGLLWVGGFSSSNQFGLKADYKKYCVHLIKRLLERSDSVIHLIAHVTEAGHENKVVKDSDIVACNELKNIYFAEEDRVVLAPVFTNPIFAKDYIAQMDYFIGARMHASIGAFSSGVVTIPVAYSKKFEGLYNNIGYLYVLDARQLDTDELIEQTLELLSKKEELMEYQAKAMIRVNEKLNAFIEDLKVISEEHNFN